MLAQKWSISVTMFLLLENISSSKSPDPLEFPLAESLGVSKAKLSKTLEDHRLGQEFMEQYQDMMRASHESFENFDDREERRLRRVVDDSEYELIDRGSPPGALNRRRSAARLQSPAGRRRARSQAVRREKLNSQGLRSHVLHSQPTNLEYN